MLKKQKDCKTEDFQMGDCWIGISLDASSGLIIPARVGKHTDRFLEELILNTEGKTDCKCWNIDDWGGYERVLGEEYEHYIGKDQTQRLERTNGITRQQTGRWHRRQNKFEREIRRGNLALKNRAVGKMWSQTEITTRLIVSYFNWIWSNIRWGNTAAQRAGLTSQRWTWNELVSYPTFF